jgi:hypothetical protein
MACWIRIGSAWGPADGNGFNIKPSRWTDALRSASLPKK